MRAVLQSDMTIVSQELGIAFWGRLVGVLFLAFTSLSGCAIACSSAHHHRRGNKRRRPIRRILGPNRARQANQRK